MTAPNRLSSQRHPSDRWSWPLFVAAVIVCLMASDFLFGVDYPADAVAVADGWEGLPLDLAASMDSNVPVRGLREVKCEVVHGPEFETPSGTMASESIELGVRCFRAEDGRHGYPPGTEFLLLSRAGRRRPIGIPIGVAIGATLLISGRLPPNSSRSS